MRAAAGWPARWRSHGIGKGDTVAVMLPNTPPMVEAHFGVPMCGAVLNALNTRLDPETVAFMLDHGEAKAVIVDPEFAAVMKKAIALRKTARPLLVVDVHGCAVHRGGGAHRRHGLRGVPGRRRPRIRVATARRRVGRDRAQLHQRHHRQSQGRGLSPSRRGGERHLQHPRMGHGQAPGVPVDAADVPLQRLVLPVDDRGARRRQRVPAQGRGQGDDRCDQGARRDALLRRTDRAGVAGERARRDEAGPAQGREGHGGRRGAAGVDDRGHGAHGFRPHARLRADGGLRAGDGLPQARRVERSGHRRARAAQRAPGRALPPAARRARDRPAHHASRCRWMAKPWARSCSAATS